MSYFAIIFIVGTVALRTYRALGNTYDSVFVSLLATWVAFNFQSLISINQIGVAVWGWILSGCLYGYSRLRFQILKGEQQKTLDKKKLKGKVLPAHANLIALSVAFFGLILAAIPQQADSKYFAAAKTRDLKKIANASVSIGATAWHRNLAIDFAMSKSDNATAIELSNKAIADYPRSFFPWKVIYVLPESAPESRVAALSKLKELDPFNPEFDTP
jgi:hypothetical protein